MDGPSRNCAPKNLAGRLYAAAHWQYVTHKMSETFSHRWTGRQNCPGPVAVVGIAAVLLAGAWERAWADRDHVGPITGYVTASDVCTNPVGAADCLTGLPERETGPDWTLYDIGRLRHGRLSEGERWEKFEAEFGADKRSSSLMKGALEEAKYQMDSATFAMNDLVKSVEERFRFDYQLRDLSSSAPRTSGLRPMYNNPFEQMIDGARLRSDVDLGTFSKRAFVGVRLVMPFGD